VDSRVSRCEAAPVASGSVMVKGGGVYTRKNLSLTRSTISYSQAVSVLGGETRGGGAYVGGVLTTLDSVIEFNRARSSQGSNFGRGGAIFAHGGAVLQSTTVRGNVADRVAGVMLYNPFPNETAALLSSTVSGNSAVDSIGGVYANFPLSVSNSTIAFNTSHGSSDWADGIYAKAAVDLTSSIIADNHGSKGLSDFGVAPGVSVAGGSDIIVKANSGTPVPPLTTSDCPKLDPLLNTGGATATHGLRSQSAAIDHGDAGTTMSDQRGFPRVIGPSADMGALERQPSDLNERIFSTSFEGLCDV
jgi:hypothetical protein